MKKIYKIFLMALIAISFQSFAKNLSESNNEIIGTWLGKLKVPGQELRIVFNIKENNNGTLTATMDSPDQGVKGIQVDTVIIFNDSIRLNVQVANGYYLARFEKDSLKLIGTWTQNGMSFPLSLSKTDKVEEIKRPQEPKKPYPYKEEEVKFENKEANIKLAGTLTLPETGNNFPAVVLITGSGPQDRNEALFNHKPFLVLADYLTRKGIAVLRYDDRGFGESEGNFGTATTKDFVSDALAAVDYLRTRKEINKNEIGLIGHSEGGLIAPWAAVKSNNIAFIVLMAGPGLPGEDILKMQTKLILKSNGLSDSFIQRTLELNEKIYNIIKTENDSLQLREKLDSLYDDYVNNLPEEEREKLGNNPKKVFESQMSFITSPWFKFFLTYDPRPTLEKVKIPVLALNGEKDMQVPPKENLAAISEALEKGGNKNFKVEELKGLNHLFQTAKTGAPSEYAKIEETISPKALEIIGDWILKVTGD